MSQSKIRLLCVIPTLRAGGAERVMVTLLKYLDPERFDLSLAVVDMNGAVFTGELPGHVKLIDLDCDRVRTAIPRIVALARRHKPDVLFSTLGHLNLAMAIAKPLLPRKMRLVARETAMVSLGIQDYPRSRLFKTLYRIFYSRLDRIVCQSHAMKEDVATTFSVPHRKMVVINNPVDVGQVRVLAQAPLAETTWRTYPVRLVAVGRLGREKGFDILLDALAVLKEPRIGLAILGEGTQGAELQAQAERLGLQKQVYFAGYQSNPYAWITRSDAFVLSSRHEGFPNVVIEALACNRPVVATPAPGGTLEILSDYPCVIAAEINAAALAQAIGAWLAKYDGRPLDADVTRYAPQAIAAQYTAIFEERA